MVLESNLLHEKWQMNVLQNLTTFYNQQPLDSTYRTVAERILEHLREASEATVNELAEITDASRTTIYRMLQKMGYKNYQDFHHDLKQAVKNYTYYNRIIPSGEILDSSDIPAYCGTQMSCISQKLELLLDPEGLQKTAGAVMNAPAVYFFLSHQSAAVNSFQQNLALAGKKGTICCLYPEQFFAARTVPSGSIIFINTIEFAESQNMTEIFKELKKNGAHIILLSTLESRYEKYADSYFIPLQEDLSIFSSLLLEETYFLMLSEIFRYTYIDGSR